MAIIRWNPYSLLRSSWPFDDEDLGLASWSVGTGDNLEVSEDDAQVVVKANVAGVDDKDIDITYQDGRLWIKAQSSSEEQDKKSKFYRKMSRAYSYVVDLPNVDPNAEPKTAETEKGVLKVVFDKAPEAKPRKIALKAKK